MRFLIPVAIISMNIVRALRERKREGKRETEIKRKEKQEERERGGKQTEVTRIKSTLTSF